MLAILENMAKMGNICQIAKLMQMTSIHDSVVTGVIGYKNIEKINLKLKREIIAARRKCFDFHRLSLKYMTWLATLLILRCSFYHLDKCLLHGQYQKSKQTMEGSTH